MLQHYISLTPTGFELYRYKSRVLRKAGTWISLFSTNIFLHSENRRVVKCRKVTKQRGKTDDRREAKKSLENETPPLSNLEGQKLPF